MLIYELVFNKKKNSLKFGLLLPSPSKIYLKQIPGSSYLTNHKKVVSDYIRKNIVAMRLSYMLVLKIS